MNCITITENTVLDFDGFCEMNAMSTKDKEKFKTLIEKAKLDTSSRKLSGWLALFNKFFDQLCAN